MMLTSYGHVEHKDQIDINLPIDKNKTMHHPAKYPPSTTFK